MVMERAAKIAATVDSETNNDSFEKEGMRFTASFLENKEENLSEKINQYQGEQKRDFISGVVQTLLRNIVLPRDGALSPSCLLALQSIETIGGKNPAVPALAGEIKQILEQYDQHKIQVQQQLEETLKNQLQQQAMAQGIEDTSQITPKMHPQYQEEMAKMLSDLNGQYLNALDERKKLLKTHLIS